MLFAIVIHKDSDSDYGVTVPDLPGCFSAGCSLDEAVVNAREAIELHIEGMLEEGLAVPVGSSDLKRLTDNDDYGGGVWLLVPVDFSNLGGRAERVNITVPERVLRKIDAAAAAAGEPRSSFLVSSAMARIAHQGDFVIDHGRKARRPPAASILPASDKRRAADRKGGPSGWDPAETQRESVPVRRAGKGGDDGRSTRAGTFVTRGGKRPATPRAAAAKKR